MTGGTVGQVERLRRSLVRIGAMAAKETLHVRRDPRVEFRRHQFGRVDG